MLLGFSSKMADGYQIYNADTQRTTGEADEPIDDSGNKETLPMASAWYSSFLNKTFNRHFTSGAVLGFAKANKKGRFLRVLPSTELTCSK
jgi:hypothetical protein